ncbi:FAD-dependent oxidoreductase [Cellulomonas sp. 179-A 9B4 NHS]|uniref:FAD-dependent oxidoreductase n=1 Tax=Cellulomonas sp. 179-A 9B4 NHS TaxID=3142379 RepID=UPI0039A2E88C
MRVGIAGAGIGGVTLAHALAAQGHDVTVWERDAAAEDTAGYRLHLPQVALDALVRTVPSATLAAVRATAAPPGTFARLSVLDHHGRTRLRIPLPPEERLLIGRRPLRAVLADGLPVRWGTRVTGYAEHPDRVEVHLADGSRGHVDLLVGADGTRSRVAHGLLGRPPSRSTGVVAIGGTAPLYPGARVRVPDALHHGLALAVGPGGHGVFLALHRPAPGAADVPGARPEGPYVVWSVGNRVDRFTADPADMTTDELLAEARHALAAWDRGYRRFVDASDPGTVASFPFVLPSSSVPPPTSGRVTLLGDAIHPMPPTAGEGAATAVRDAAALADALAAVGTAPSAAALAAALASYGRAMAAYAPAAVREALPALRWQRRLASPWLRVPATAVGLPLAGAALAAADRVRRGASSA